MPTNSSGCCAVPLTPESPTIPIANPAASPLSPTLKPAPRSTKLLNRKEKKRELCSIPLPQNLNGPVEMVNFQFFYFFTGNRILHYSLEQHNKTNRELKLIWKYFNPDRRADLEFDRLMHDLQIGVLTLLDLASKPITGSNELNPDNLFKGSSSRGGGRKMFDLTGFR